MKKKIFWTTKKMGVFMIATAAVAANEVSIAVGDQMQICTKSNKFLISLSFALVKLNGLLESTDAKRRTFIRVNDLVTNMHIQTYSHTKRRQLNPFET